MLEGLDTQAAASVRYTNRSQRFVISQQGSGRSVTPSARVAMAMPCRLPLPPPLPPPLLIPLLPPMLPPMPAAALQPPT